MGPSRYLDGFLDVILLPISPSRVLFEPPPMANPRDQLFERIQSQLRALEKKRKSKIFVYVEADGDHICNVQRHLLFSKKSEFRNVDKLEVLLHSGGGHAEFAYQIAKLFRRRCKQLNVIVPGMAKSAATLICLAADTIFMGERAELGPLDVQITDPVEKGLRTFSPLDEFKSMEYLKEYSIDILDYYAMALVERSGMSLKEAFHQAMPAVTNLMAPLYNKIDPSKIGNYRQSLAVGEEYAKRLLTSGGSVNPEKIAQSLVWKYPAHDFIIDRFEAKQMGLPAVNLSEGDDDLFYDVIGNIYSYGESIYAFTEAAKTRGKSKSKRKTAKGVPATKPPSNGAVKSAVVV